MRFQCPECQEIVVVDNSAAGKTVQCGRCQKNVKVPDSRTSPGALIADFIIEKELGRGGMGIVYLSHQISLDREAALKVLSSTYANNAEFVVGFIKEARAAAKLNHPHIVQAYAVGEDEGLYYFAMENIDGTTMKQILDKKKIIPVDEAVQIIQQIAEALDYAWAEQRLIHRDIKPDNIMLTKNGKAKLADLGLARVAGEKDDMESEDEVMGTPQYISPEALLGEPMDVRSDIYSLGATFYQFVTGKFPFNGNSASEIAKKHITDPLIPPIEVNPKIPQAVSDVIVKMMEKDPNNRYQDAEKLVEDLRNIRKYKGGGKMPRLTIPNASGQKKSSPTLTIKRNGPGTVSQPAPQPPQVEKKSETKENSEKISKVKDMKASRERQAVGKLAMMIFGFVLLIAMIVGGVLFYISANSAKPKVPGRSSAKKLTGAPVKTEKVQEPSDTPLTAKADEILKSIAAKAGNNPEESVALCEEFFRNFPSPKYTREKEKYAEINKAFHENDEKITIILRQNARDTFLKNLENEREAAIRRQQDAERRAAERREREQREREQRRIAELNRKKAEEELWQLRRKIAELRPKICIELIDLCSKNDFPAAKKLLAEAIQVNSQKERRGKSQKWITEASRFAGWASRRRNWLNQADSFRKHLINGGEELKKPQIVFKGNFGYVTSIRNGIATAEDGGKVFRVNLSHLSRTQYLSFVIRLSNKMGNQQRAFYYVVLGGNFNPPSELMPYNWMKRDLNEIATDYFREKYRKADTAQKKELIRKYGKMPVFRKAAGLKPLKN